MTKSPPRFHEDQWVTRKSVELGRPVALSTARAFGADPTPFVMLVAYTASAAFPVPSGYQAHLMVFSPGRYRVMDFVRTGIPVSLLYGGLVMTLVPIFPF